MIMCKVKEKSMDGANYKLRLKAESEFKVGDVLTDQKNFDYLILGFENPKDADRTKKEVVVMAQQLD
ncbi:MAG: hypothetical protein ACOX7J_07560 [Bacillota bacterium]|jgi:hypothetical protein